MMESRDHVVVAKIQKNAREQLWVFLDEFHGRPVFSSRVFYDAGDGEMRPGKSGTTFKVELLPDFADAVSLALEAARARGLVK